MGVRAKPPARGAPRSLVLVTVLACSVAAFADASAPKSAAPADLQEARSRLEKAPSPADYAAMLDSFSSVLSPSDALALLDQGIPLSGPDYRRELLVKAADLDLLVGLFGDAASRYEAASSSLPTGEKDLNLLLRAARCFIAAGDSEKASALSFYVAQAAGDPDLAAAARLVGAWALVMQGRADDASSLALAIATAPKAETPKVEAPKAAAAVLSSENKREARFLVWLCSKAADKAAAASALASEFPDSPEALIARGSASTPPLPHWYLGGLEAAQAVKRPEPEPPSPPASTSREGKRLQVGYFSREENAQALKAELASKGFAAAVEPRLRAAGAGKPEEKRWIVVVGGGKDLAKTLQSLKDAGYESYIID